MFLQYWHLFEFVDEFWRIGNIQIKSSAYDFKIHMSHSVAKQTQPCVRPEQIQTGKDRHSDLLVFTEPMKKAYAVSYP